VDIGNKETLVEVGEKHQVTVNVPHVEVNIIPVNVKCIIMI